MVWFPLILWQILLSNKGYLISLTSDLLTQCPAISWAPFFADINNSFTLIAIKRLVFQALSTSIVDILIFADRQQLKKFNAYRQSYQLALAIFLLFF